MLSQSILITIYHAHDGLDLVFFGLDLCLASIPQAFIPTMSCTLLSAERAQTTTRDYSAKMFVGHTDRIVHVPANASQTPFMATDCESDTSLFTKTPPGLGLELGVILFHNVTGRPEGTLKGLFSYDGPTILRVWLSAMVQRSVR